MLKKTITYTDFDGVERTEDFYFNLSKMELTEMEITTPGGMAAKLENITKAQNVPEIYEIFKGLVLKAYGEKSEDGRHFRKNATISEEFSQTEAYSVLMMELLADENKAAEFFNGIVPADLNKQIEEAKAQLSIEKPEA